MPEGHTLHRLAAQLAKAFGGRRVLSSSPQGRFAAGAAVVDDLVLARAEAYGKHLLVSFDDTELAVHVHLGLFGQFSITEAVDSPLTGAIRWRLATRDVTADLRGPNACELLDPSEVAAIVARLGPDPLRADADPDLAWSQINRSGRPIAALLMDQRVIAGVGNVYRAEILFRNGIDPYLPGSCLESDQWQSIWHDLVSVMGRGVRASRIDTVRAEHEPAVMGRSPRVDDHGGEVYVYRRDGMGCLVCGSVVQSATLANRNLFWCPKCQRPG